MIGFGAIYFTISCVTAPLTESAEENVGAIERLGERARGGLHGVARLPLVHAILAALIDHAFGVAEDQVLGPEADRLEQFEAGYPGSARAVADQLGGRDLAAGQIERIQQAGGGDDGSAVLVVVKNRNVHAARAGVARSRNIPAP